MNMETKLVRAALALVKARRAFEALHAEACRIDNGAAIGSALIECEQYEKTAREYAEFHTSYRVKDLPRVSRALGVLRKAATEDAALYADARIIIGHG